MNTFPDLWSSTTLEEICGPEAPIIYGILQPGPDTPGGVPYVRPTEIGANGIDLESLRRTTPDIAAKYSRSTLKSNDLLLSIVGTIGKVAVVPPELEGGNITQSSCRIRPDKDAMVYRFMAHFLRSPQAIGQYGNNRLGTAVPRLNLADVRRISAPVPPLPEQRRIVAKLDRLSEHSSTARDHLTRVTALATRAKQAILSQCLSGDWPFVPLSQIANIGTGATPKKGTPRFYEGGTIPWVTSGAVNDFRIKSAEQFITPVAITETNCKVYPAGTLLMAMYGEGKTRGMVARLDIDAATNQALAAIQIKSDAPVRDEWVIWLLHSQYLKLRELASGGVQPNLNLRMVKSILVPTQPMAIQEARLKKIKNALARIDRLTEEACCASHLLDRLDERLLAKAFQGELVPQDPDDEPAEVLLKRIREARATAPKPKRSGRKKTA